MTELHLLQVIIMIQSAFFALYFWGNRRARKAKILFNQEVERAKSLLKEKKRLDKMFNAINSQQATHVQMSYWNEIFDLLDEADKKRKLEPNAIPDHSDQVMHDINYKFTLLRNE